MDLTEEIIEKICSHVKMGAMVDTAAMAMGIPMQTLAEWLDLGAAGTDDDIHAIFLSRIDQARAQGEILHIHRIVSQGGPRESQWLLERMYPDRWAAKKNDVSKKQTAQIIDAAFTFDDVPKPKRIKGK